MPLIQRAEFHLTQLLAAAVKVNPNPNGLPGVNAFQKLLNGAVVLAGMACALGFVIGAAQWGIGSKSNNYSQAADGRERMLKSAAGASKTHRAIGLISGSSEDFAKCWDLPDGKKACNRMAFTPLRFKGSVPGVEATLGVEVLKQG